jgi:NAD(P)H dehydrogenase (quinone)
MKDPEASTVLPLSDSHFKTEDYIKKSGLTYTLLRNTLYTDGIAVFAGPQVFETGIYLPSGDGKVPYALRREMGEAAANVLLRSGHENKTYEITGSELYSYGDAVRELSALSGKSVTYTDADADKFPAQLREWGLPEEVIFIVAGFSADIKSQQFERTTKDLETLLGRKPANLRDGLKEIYNL